MASTNSATSARSEIVAAGCAYDGSLIRGRRFAAVVAVALVAAAPARAHETEVVVALDSPPLATAVASSRVLTVAAKRERLDVRSGTSASYLRDVSADQRALAQRIRHAIPRARIRRSYSVVANALAVVVPAGEADRLGALAGVARVYPSIRYRARALHPNVIATGAPALWSSDLSTAGNGIKIGIVDDGIDQTHPYFNPRGYAFPAGFPKGQTGFTTPKVIVARAFPPRSPSWRHAAKPFDPEQSEHGTHVAGIAAGNNSGIVVARDTVSGIAPRAYLGNYKVLTIPTASGVGLDGNSPEIVAGIEAAVRDGMDVINLSLGEPEIEPSRDIVVRAIDAAADAGVVPVIAAGNDFDEFGRGSIGSPGSARKAVTVGATTETRTPAPFSSSGPTPVSLQLKPDLVAPGTGIISSVPAREGTWAAFSGTSMAAPHIAGGAALLRQRHPGWSVAQLKSALVLTASPLAGVPTTRQGAGFVSLPRANAPLVFVSPSAVSFGILRGGARVTRTVELADAGGGGTWRVDVAPQGPSPVRITAPTTLRIPGRLSVSAAVTSLRDADVTGFVRLVRGDDVRVIPYWARVAPRTLARHAVRPLNRTGTYRGNTRGRPALVSSYRYPERSPTGADRFAGPEQVFRVRVGRGVANFGVAIVSAARGVRLSARVVFAGDEDHQVGYTALPVNLNPYLPTFLQPRAVSGAVLPAPGAYDVVFDSASRATAGRFTFRFWLNDTRPPTVRLVTRSASAGGALQVRVSDSGSGLDTRSLLVRVDGRTAARASLRGGRLTIPVSGLARGRHSLLVQASDLQETRNMENVPRILPNTRRLETTFVVR